ncbi:MAG: hypothetical protein HWE12_00335 [Oceanospirillaceae bacterium]|nr:hypothetical protein [Oceanospirillaceae bacterium]
MNQKYSAETNTLKFASEDLNDSDYLKLARDYRNNESGEILLELFSLIKQAVAHKLKSACSRLLFNLRHV